MCGRQAWSDNAFLDLPDEYAQPDNARFCVLPLPHEQTVSFGKGTAAGPAAILEASAQVELFDEQFLREFYHAGIHTLPPLHLRGSLENIDEQIYTAAAGIVQMDKFLLTLGGEHSITAPLVKAYQEKYSDLSVLQIDAHADLRAEYDGSPYSHACVMRRIHEMKVPCLGVGIRSFCGDEHEYMQVNQIDYISPSMIRQSLPDVLQSILNALTDQVYITFDIDGLDPSVSPGTGTPEPGGLWWHEALAILEAVGRSKRIVGADVVEVAPIAGQQVTEFAAARLAYKLIAVAQLRQ